MIGKLYQDMPLNIKSKVDSPLCSRVHSNGYASYMIGNSGDLRVSQRGAASGHAALFPFPLFFNLPMNQDVFCAALVLCYHDPRSTLTTWSWTTLTCQLSIQIMKSRLAALNIWKRWFLFQRRQKNETEDFARESVYSLIFKTSFAQLTMYNK